jgi:2-succinyl-5-enolpyruvyl-6-hydroxy-3-cyclohexene-1-carboxylate synthase
MPASRWLSSRPTGRPQTTDQVGIFEPAVTTLDIATDEVPALGRAITHWNVQFTEPLVPSDRWKPTMSAGPRSCLTVTASDVPLTRRLEQGPRTVVVAGDDAGPRARQIAEAGGWPLLAEPTSGSRCGSNAIRTYRLLLDGELGAQIERVIVAGHPTLSRPIAQLLGRAHVYELPARGIWPTRPFAVAGVLADDVVVQTDPDPTWLDAWVAADRDLGRRVDARLAEEGFAPHHVAAAVGAALAAGEQLVVGASNPIRDLDLMMRPYPVGERRKVLANRGLAGIDGVVSTAIGVALTRDTRAYALMGDVTFLHDSNGLILGPDEPRPDLVIVVVNDDGGSIFATLEQGAQAYADRFERLFATPHGVDISALCAATRTPHLKVASVAELGQALANPNGGIEVIEATVGRRDRRELEQALRRLVSG